MHLHPTTGTPRDVAEPIVRMLYPEGQPTRIPIIAVTGTNGKTTVVRLVAHVFETAHACVGMTTTDGVYIGKERVMAGDCAGPRSALAVLLHPHVDVAVLEAARGGIIREGLGYDAATIGVVTNVSADHLGSGGVETVDDLARVKQVVVEAVAPDGAAVLNADDPLVAEMAASTAGEIIYFSRRPASQVIAAHLAAGGRCVLADGDGIVLRHGPARMELIELSRVAFTNGGAIAFQVANALAATAAAWGAGVNPALIARALSTFRSDATMVPGRFNRVEVDGIEFVLDYAHNEAAMHALGDAVATLDERRTYVVMGLPGDRRDEDLARTVEASQRFAHAYVFHDQHDRRGREPGEVPRLLAARVSSGVPVHIAPTQLDALRRVWGEVRAGDRVVVVVDEVEETLAAVQALADAETCAFPVGGGHAYAPADRHVFADRAW